MSNNVGCINNQMDENDRMIRNNDWVDKLDKLNVRVENSRNLVKNKGFDLKVDFQNGDNPNIHDVQRKITKVKINWMRLMILVWNMQSLNINCDESFKKKSFLLEQIAKINPEIIFLIDMGPKSKNFQMSNYRLVNDGRNILGIRFDIKNDVVIENGVFKMKEIDLNFAYVRPLEKNDELVREVKDLIKNNKAVIGDINQRSNKFDLSEYNRILGEDTLQTIYLKKNDNNSETLINMAPSDHNLVVFNVKRRVKHSSQITIEGINFEKCYDIIQQIFQEGRASTEIKIVPNKKIIAFDEEKRLVDNILNDFITNNTTSVFKRYEYIWKNFRKEPFLGTFIPTKVEQGLKFHYKHEENKQYKNIFWDDNISLEDLTIRFATKSKALNNELVKLNDIDNSLKVIWYDIMTQGKTKSAISNFIKFCNDTKEEMAYTTFFLRKSKQLETFNDIRIISIVPVQIKIWENLIYDRVIEYLSQIIDKNVVYQFGGKAGCSTYEAMFRIQEKFHLYNAEGILFLDLTKGYDSVNWKILEQDIQIIQDVSVKALLNIWLLLVRNTDALANNNKIKKTRGLGMGLALAPILFEYYVHLALCVSKVDRGMLVMYVDDLAILLLNAEEGFDKFRRIEEEFKKRDLLFNNKKSAIITKNKEIKEKFETIDIKTKDTEKYLGVVIGINNEKDLVTDDRYFKLANNFACIPKMICFGVKKRIIDAAIIARTRYSTMMFSLKNRIEKGNIIRYIWSSFKREFFKLSYVQLISFMFNFTRFVIDLHDMEEIRNNLDLIDDEMQRSFMASEVIKEKMKTGIKQWDNIVSSWNLKIMDPRKWSVSLMGIRNLCNHIWKDFRRHALLEWFEEKKKENVNINDNFEQIVGTKIFINYKTIQNIVLRHYDITKIDFFIFIFVIFRNIKANLQNEDKDWNDNFVMFNINFLKKDEINKDNLVSYFNELYSEMDDIILDIIEQDCKECKTRFKNILNILTIVEEICNRRDTYKRNTSELLYIFNLKKGLNEDYINKTAKIIDVEDNNEHYETLYESPENLDCVISIDGSANDSKCGGGLVLRYNKDGKIKDQEKFYFKISEEWYDIRNVAGEVLAAIKAIELAIEKKWKQVNIVFDYIGVCMFLKGLWYTKNPLIIKAKKKFIRLLQESHIVINWLKVYSHTAIRINDLADILAKTGCEILEPENDMISINQPDLD